MALWQPRGLAARHWLRFPMYILDDDMIYDLLLQLISMTNREIFSLMEIGALNEFASTVTCSPWKAQANILRRHSLKLGWI